MSSKYLELKKCISSGVLVFFILTSFGCATYKSGTKKAFDAVEKGNYPVAIKEMKKNLKPTGNDQLLYYLEVGLLKHLNREYEESNRLLTQAAQISEDLETIRASDQLGAALTSPRQTSYAGTKFERVFIHYYKALNYILLAEKSPAHRASLLEGARIEARKVNIMLTALNNEEGTYQEVKDKKKGLFSKALKLFDELNGNFRDESLLVYREDAYVRYITGLIYEANGEYDDARISYQQAAELYENGYQKQYQLGDAITEQAWFDVVRMMRWAGGYGDDWPLLAESKLSVSKRKELDTYKKGTSQLVVIEHLGMIPPRDEMNVHLTLDKKAKDLVVKPVLTGSQQERRDQFTWFHAMYSDKGLLNAFKNMSEGGVHQMIDRRFSKRIGIGPVWELAESIGLPKAVGSEGIRITVPYYRPHASPYGETTLWVDGTSVSKLIPAQSVSRLALQEQLLGAGSDLQQALARELVKAIFAKNVTGLVGGETLGFLAKVVNTATSQAETRNWLTLPEAIRITRLPVSKGEHSIKLTTNTASNNGLFSQSERHFAIREGEIYILRNRTISRAKGTFSKKANLTERKILAANQVTIN
ncbi:MAG TPA: hypothetical protein ENK06_08010 [Gammaproteobacteria bacterium]|nr:hypothetical protein [Gammaproteobacteria bacterium]